RRLIAPGTPRACSGGVQRRCRTRPAASRYAPHVSDRRRARFARLVAKALDGLPAEFRDRMRNIDIVVEDDPDPQREGEHGGLLGLYEGTPLVDRGQLEPFLPDRITIYRRPIEAMTSSPAGQAAIVRDTVVHEVAHHFGISDERLDELGLGDAT
ncbi:MAG: metallopeptidase family protein, partial [Candidatus Limnocylindria bacterium]